MEVAEMEATETNKAAAFVKMLEIKIELARAEVLKAAVSILDESFRHTVAITQAERAKYVRDKALKDLQLKNEIARLAILKAKITNHANAKFASKYAKKAKSDVLKAESRVKYEKLIVLGATIEAKKATFAKEEAVKTFTAKQKALKATLKNAEAAIAKIKENDPTNTESFKFVAEKDNILKDGKSKKELLQNTLITATKSVLRLLTHAKIIVEGEEWEQIVADVSMLCGVDLKSMYEQAKPCGPAD